MNFIISHCEIYEHCLSTRFHFLYFFLLLCEMMDREKVGVFDFQSEDSQGMLIHILGMYP